MELGPAERKRSEQEGDVCLRRRSRVRRPAFPAHLHAKCSDERKLVQHVRLGSKGASARLKALHMQLDLPLLLHKTVRVKLVFRAKLLAVLRISVFNVDDL